MLSSSKAPSWIKNLFLFPGLRITSFGLSSGNSKVSANSLSYSESSQLKLKVIPRDILLVKLCPTLLSTSSYASSKAALFFTTNRAQRVPSFLRQRSFPESFVIWATGTVNHGFAAALYFGWLSFLLGSTNIYEWTLINSNILA